MFDMLLYLTFGLALVLVLRGPMRRLFGAAPTFMLWLLPPWLAALPWLPIPAPDWFAASSLQVVPAARLLMAQASPPLAGMHWWWLVWVVGSAPCVVRLAWHYRRMQRDSRPLPAALLRALLVEGHALDPRSYRLHPAGPAVLWAPSRCRILLPEDFLQRFDVEQRRLVLQHEHTHVRRGDGLWCLLAELAVAMLWFHPLAWLALSRLRLDQELACDECVLRQSPQSATRYARTLLHGTGVTTAPVFIPWLTQPQLKERLLMIQRTRPGNLRRCVGFAALAVLMAGSTSAVLAATHDHMSNIPIETPTTAVSFRPPPPIYPKSAIKNKHQGIVYLDVLVGTDGSAKQIKLDPKSTAPSDLVQSAMAAAEKWRFNPGTKNGQSVEGWVRIPITFELDDKQASSHPATP